MKIIIILDFTSSEHQAPFNFSSSTESFDGHIYKGQKLIFHTVHLHCITEWSYMYNVKAHRELDKIINIWQSYTYKWQPFV